MNEPLSVSPDLSAMTKNELLEYGDKNGVEGISGAMKKADIIAAINGGLNKY